MTKDPVHRVAGQGVWYALGNALGKVAGLILLPLYTNTEFLSKEAFGLWGTFEVTVQLAIGIVGLQLAFALIRFYSEPGISERVTSTAWWTTMLLAAGTAIPILAILQFAVAPSNRLIYELLVIYIAFEILLTIPLSLLRVRDQAGWYTGLIIFRLLLAVGFNLWTVRQMGLGLVGLVGSYAGASVATLIVALVMTTPAGVFQMTLDRPLAMRMLQFSVPLVVAGIGSMALNASDRYVLLAFRTEEEVGLYTLAAKFGGVINMLAAQPLQMALLPILFRLRDSEREPFLNATGKHLVFILCLLAIGVTVFTEPVIHAFRSDAFYLEATTMVPWIALGFVAFGLGILMDGVLTLYGRTGAIAFWLSLAAILNLGLNFAIVPKLGAFGAALSTFASYLVLLVGKYYAGTRLVKLQLPLKSMAGIAITCMAFAVGSVYLDYPDGIVGLLMRSLVAAGWLLLVLVAGWIRLGEIKNLMRAFVPARQTP